MPWVGLRRDIALEFVALIPTQWSLLFNGWVFKPTWYWNDDSGELVCKKRISQGCQWQWALRQQQLRREDNRCVQKMRRSANRREAIKKRKYCAQCGREMDHTKSHNVRKFCDKSCYELWWSPDEVLKRG